MNVDFLERFFLPCPSKLFTGCDCPACGTQRSVLSLLQGDFAESWQYNPAGIGFAVVILMALWGRYTRHRLGTALPKATACLVLAAMMLKWLLKIFDGTCCS